MLRYTDYDIVFREIPEEVVERLLARYGAAVTCFCLMGGDAEPHEAARLALFARRLRPALRTGWYSGRAALPEGFDPTGVFDYVKLGPYIAARGPLDDPATACGQTPRERPNSGQTDERIGRFEKNAYLYALFYRIRRPKALCPASGN